MFLSFTSFHAFDQFKKKVSGFETGNFLLYRKELQVSVGWP